MTVGDWDGGGCCVGDYTLYSILPDFYIHSVWDQIQILQNCLIPLTKVQEGREPQTDKHLPQSRVPWNGTILYMRGSVALQTTMIICS